MANETLLAAEEAVQNVLTSLNQLRQEIEGYATAKESLEKVRDVLATMAAKTDRLAEETHSVIDTMGKIGTPEILGRVGELCSLTEGLGRDSSVLMERLEASDKAQKAWTDMALTAIGDVGKAVQGTLAALESQVVNRLSEQGNKIEKALASLTSQVTEQQRMALQELEGVMSGLQTQLTAISERNQRVEAQLTGAATRAIEQGNDVLSVLLKVSNASKRRARLVGVLIFRLLAISCG
ncbi:MAG: hypothetical protein NT031_12725 [Planctomycetota bacterium]|nr:hypothetical protein [Planctomycetota bacterium]